MGKYLQDLMYRVQLPAGQKKLTPHQQLVVQSTSFLENIFNFYLPSRYEVGQNIWRIIVNLTLDEKTDFNTVVSGFVIELNIYFDYNSLIHLDEFNRKKILLIQFCRGLEFICQKYSCDFSIFEAIQQKLILDNLVYHDFYKDKKASPDKQHFVQMKGFYAEDAEKCTLSVSLFDKQHNEKAIFLVGNYNFQWFEKLKWLDNKSVGVFHINRVQSYKSKKVAEDYFSIDIETGLVQYNPVTRESIFDYALKLLTEENLIEKAFYYFEQAKKLGHGKVENILRNLETDSDLRDKAKLLQTPKRQK
ncbi:hypothetical protein GOQ04_12805 [Emticicia sp. ODNR4P]|jgi:hypothetical protein|nr:hypothetical protein [Emticicia sp. ODNR4P]